MENRWHDLAFPSPLDECVHGSRLIGAEASLVLHGGGNSSIKAPWTDVTGDEIDGLYVKGSGWDMATIERAGFAPLALDRLRRLLTLDRLSDTAMMTALSAARLDPGAPQPSVEALLHGLLPHRAVQHSHADVVIALGERAGAVLGPAVLVIPYVMPGFLLAKALVTQWSEEGSNDIVGLVLEHHGLVTFGDSTKEAYDRHIELISMAERWLDEHAPAAIAAGPALPSADRVQLASLRRRISDAAGAPMIVSRHVDASVRRFVARPDLASVATRGPLTPDHVIRTKAIPLVGTDVDAFVAAYRRYVTDHRDGDIVELDPAPRIVLDPELGMLTVGRTVKDAQIAADIYEHTIGVIERVEDHLGGYRALGARDLFAMEYWELEQAKLRLGAPRPMAGRVALVTGAASGIGRACAEELAARGAVVAGIDIVASPFGEPCDVTDSQAVEAAFQETVERFGGVDVVVASAGIFGASAPIAELDAAEWRRVMSINVDAVGELFRIAHPVLAQSPASPAVVLIASKNVPAPGRGAAAYSASKAAVTQLARIAALEWGSDGIRVNVVHPDAVFDTGLWTPELVAERAASYGLSVEAYRRRNLLGREIRSVDVARAVVELCGDSFVATTGAQIPIDGGSDRVI